jgi:hypothetical protein
MIAIGVRPKGNTPVAHLAEPIELAVKRHVLEDAKEADEEAETHPKPEETAPVLNRSKCLNGNKKNNEVGEEKEELHPRVVR